MYEFMPQVIREIQGQMIEVFWLMIIPFTLFLIVLEYFKITDSEPNIPNIIKRVAISIILLISFDQIASLISATGDSLAEKVGGLSSLNEVLDELARKHENLGEIEYKLRDFIIFTLSLLSYLVAYLGIFIADALIHFVWAVLYVISPIMILLYISPATADITKNLYKSLLTVMSWKVLWSILAIMLLKFATGPKMSDSSDGMITVILINLFIGISMLFIPMATKSLISDGLAQAASAMAAVPAYATAQTAAHYLKSKLKSGAGRFLKDDRSTQSVNKQRQLKPAKGEGPK